MRSGPNGPRRVLVPPGVRAADVLVAVTGNMGSGKSTLAGMLEAHGARRVDADALARRLVDETPALVRTLAEAFGEDLLDADGQLDRRELARRAFADERGRQRLESIVRPHLEPRLWRELAAALAESRIVVFDAPLVFEWEIQDRFDAVVLIRTEARIATARVADARGLSAEEVTARRAQQHPGDGKSVDYVVDNDGDLEHLRAAAARIWEDLSRRSGEQNQR